ncbi:MAG: ABC transporter permease [Lachnospiraceae bacterium]|nr:ABC transporter permease [Lachnospiraceae bacterium]
MEHYTDIAFRYIRMNKRRSILTILGVSISVMLLYMLINLSWSYLLNFRTELRKTADYEIVLFTEGEGQINDILSDARVKDGTVAEYYQYDYHDPVTYENALYLNTMNPYKLDKIFAGLKSDYQVDGKLNEEMAAAYLQGSDSNMIYILILTALLISYIVAIFGVGIIRNSVQLNMLERIKDFGQLRCIGSTKRQLKWLIYLQGAVLELGGIILGTLLGVMGSLIFGAVAKWEHTGFHLLPMGFILIAFLGDLYFAMDENAKLVTGMTPVSAIRGEYRIRNEKYKRRHSFIFGKLFGLTGDYAYKSIKRNPGRFYRTIAAMSLGIATSMMIFGAMSSYYATAKQIEDECGYFHIYFDHAMKPWEIKDELISSIPSYGVMENVSRLSGVSEAKRIYDGYVPLADSDKYITSKYNEDYIASQSYQEDGGLGIYDYDDGSSEFIGSCLMACGYDDEDMERYKDYLIEGELPHNDNELLMVVYDEVGLYDKELDRLYKKPMRFMDYNPGDTIDIINVELFRKLAANETRKIKEESDRKVAELQDKADEALKNGDEAAANRINDLDIGREQANCFIEEIKVYGKVYKELIEKGEYTTYTISGILNGDINQGKGRHIFDGIFTFSKYKRPTLILPKEQYFELMGIDDEWISGMQYHFDRMNVKSYFDAIYELTAAGERPTDQFGEYLYAISYYEEWVEYKQSFGRTMFAIGLIVFFIVLMSAFNTINATASNLYLRRKELAQLRVLGASKKELYKMVVFEGVIESLIAGLLGVVLGIVSSLGVYYIAIYGYYESHYVFPWFALIISVVAAALLLCGAVYVPLKRMGNDVASDLITAGE